MGLQSHVPFQMRSGLGVIGSRLNAQNLPFPHYLPALPPGTLVKCHETGRPSSRRPAEIVEYKNPKRKAHI